MKRKIICALLCSFLFISNANYAYAATTPLSAAYNVSSLTETYINELKISIPAEWTYTEENNNGVLSRSYIIDTGNVMQIYYTELPNTENLTGNYTYTDTAVNSAVNGLDGYSEIYRENIDISGYPVTLLSYQWTNNDAKITSYTIGIETNQGLYLIMTAISDSYLLSDPDILTDFSDITIAEATIVSYSDTEIIKFVQEHLNSRGYDCGTADGIIGNTTKSAIQNYRTDNSLTEGDFIDDELLTSLSNMHSPQPNTSEGVSASNGKFKNAIIFEADVTNGFGTEVIGKRAYIIMPKEVLQEITEEEYATFVETSVDGSGYNWFSIICDDGTGINFAGSFSAFGTYGELDNEGCITKALGYITLTETGYLYESAE